MAERPRRQSQRRLLVLPGLRTGDAGARQGLDRQCRLDVRLHRQPAPAPELLQRLQGRGASSDQIPGGGMGRPRRARQRCRADLYRYPLEPLRHGESGDVQILDRRHADAPHGHGRGDRLGGAVPGLRCGKPADGEHRAGGRRLQLLVGGPG